MGEREKNSRRRIAEEMARQERGSTTFYEGIVGTRVTKSPEDSERAGLDYAVETLGARIARGGTVEQWEIDALVEKGRSLGWSDPEVTVKDLIESWKDVASHVDKRGDNL